jgi:TPR repeat protein/serine/threonine protein kinase
MHREQIDNQPSSSGGKELPAGTLLLEFVIERVLGSGGFGITYLARDTSLNRQVVIKENLPAQFAHRDTTSLTVHPGPGREDQENFRWSMENFSREGEMLASLRHPGIVPVLRRFDAFGTAYFVMPFVEGLALDDLMRKRGDHGQWFSEEELTGWLAQILDALAHLHDRGIYHRDIKPGNILITNEGIPVLIDFGSARQRLSERSMTVVESAGYTPFEQLQSRGNVGPWSDLYALGATLVKVLTGDAPPKANDRTMGDPWQPLVERSELVGRFSKGFLGCLDRAVRLLIEERWQNALEWKSAMEAGTVPKLANHRLDQKLGQKEARKRFSLAYVIVILAICGTAGFGGWWFSQEGNVPPLFIRAGGLVIGSDPAGAEVKDNTGRSLGVTPLEIKNLDSEKRLEFELSLRGYDSARVVAEVIAGQTKWVPLVKLAETPQKIIVTSNPTAAEVVENGKIVGTTPWESELRVVGSTAKLTLNKRGYHPLEVDAVLEVGKSASGSFELKRDEFWAKNVMAKERLGLAEAGDPYAQALVGWELAMGTKEGLSKTEIAENNAAGKQWAEKSAKQNHPLGLALQGALVALQGGGDSENQVRIMYEQAVANRLLDDAGKGDPVWENFVGIAYQSGRGVIKDEAEAVKWYSKAAEQGFEEAQYNLGFCYANGIGISKDEAEAVKWYRKASDQGNAAAQCYLGFCYANGNGVSKDNAEALKWYRKAADQEYYLAQCFLGDCYANGNGISKDNAEAVKWYTKAAEQGYKLAQFFLGDCYANGNGISKDEAEAVSWYRKSADQGYVHAQFSLSVCYLNGKGVHKDAEESVRWCRKAAEQGLAIAQNNLGISYANGSGITKDQSEAVKWFRKAANQGADNSQFMLGNCYWNGDGVSKDLAEAVKWYRKSADQGFAEAQKYMGILYADGSIGVKKNTAEALKWFRKATAGGVDCSSAIADLTKQDKPKDVAEAKPSANSYTTIYTPAPTSRSAASDYPTANGVPGKPGYVFSPYTNQIVDVRNIRSGTLVNDPKFSTGDKFFRVP